MATGAVLDDARLLGCVLGHDDLAGWQDWRSAAACTASCSTAATCPCRVIGLLDLVARHTVLLSSQCASLQANLAASAACELIFMCCII